MISIKDAYNLAAKTYRSKYDAIPPRAKDIENAFSYINKGNPFVLEIGCAYGREAQFILKKTNKYIGIDISDVYIKMAKTELQGGDFICTDVLDYDFPNQLDIVFSFASLLHMSKEDVAMVVRRVYDALNIGGVFFLSLKRRDTYCSELVNDGVVLREFYYYNKDAIQELLPVGFKIVDYQEQELKEGWFTMVLQKEIQR